MFGAPEVGEQGYLAARTKFTAGVVARRKLGSFRNSGCHRCCARTGAKIVCSRHERFMIPGLRNEPNFGAQTPETARRKNGRGGPGLAAFGGWGLGEWRARTLRGMRLLLPRVDTVQAKWCLFSALQSVITPLRGFRGPCPRRSAPFGYLQFSAEYYFCLLTPLH